MRDSAFYENPLSGAEKNLVSFSIFYRFADTSKKNANLVEFFLYLVEVIVRFIN